MSVRNQDIQWDVTGQVPRCGRHPSGLGRPSPSEAGSWPLPSSNLPFALDPWTKTNMVVIISFQNQRGMSVFLQQMEATKFRRALLAHPVTTAPTHVMSCSFSGRRNSSGPNRVLPSKQAGKQASKQANKPTNKQIGRQSNKQANKQSDGRTKNQASSKY